MFEGWGWNGNFGEEMGDFGIISSVSGDDSISMDDFFRWKIFRRFPQNEVRFGNNFLKNLMVDHV